MDMTAFPQLNTDFERTKEIAEALLQSKIALYQSIKGGRNSRVYKLEMENGENFVAKFYFSDKSDSRERLGVEFSSFQFLWEKGIRCIPQPLIKEHTNQCAIYEYISGKNFDGRLIATSDIDQLLDFFNRLQIIKKNVEPDQFPKASEACFSMEEIFDNIERRKQKLENIDNNDLRGFLKDEFNPFMRELSDWCKGQVLRQKISFAESIPFDKRVLSPSDFGFHNAIKRGNEQIVFFDFEYFGWDDPAKTISDFLLHPAMNLTEETKKHFLKRILPMCSDNHDFFQRLKIVYPLFGMKWCLIFLNEFLSLDLSRRLFANHQIFEERLLKEQLGKAKNMLQKMKDTYKEFPYAK